MEFFELQRLGTMYIVLQRGANDFHLAQGVRREIELRALGERRSYCVEEADSPWSEE